VESRDRKIEKIRKVQGTAEPSSPFPIF